MFATVVVLLFALGETGLLPVTVEANKQVLNCNMNIIFGGDSIIYHNYRRNYISQIFLLAIYTVVSLDVMYIYSTYKLIVIIIRY